MVCVAVVFSGHISLTTFFNLLRAFAIHLPAMGQPDPA
jgi:hypothetical protein